MPAKIYYIHPCDIRATRKEKFEWLQNIDFKDIPFEIINPDEKNNWISIESNNYSNLTPLISKDVKNDKQNNAIFKMYSMGTNTGIDDWFYDKSIGDLKEKMLYFIDVYNRQAIKFGGLKQNEIINDVEYSIKWTRELRKNVVKGNKYKFDNAKIQRCSFRPFCKEVLYYETKLLKCNFLNRYIFPNATVSNTIISFNSNSKGFTLLGSNIICDLHFTGDSQCIPMFRFDDSGNQKDNITDWGLEQFRNHYSQLPESSKLSGSSIAKEDIFHYVYGVLHNPNYRKKYELNLKREFPRIPFYTNFWQWAAWGKELMDLHINYETVEPYPLKLKQLSGKQPKKTKELFPQPEKLIDNLFVNDDFVPKAKLKANKETGEIILDELTSLTGIPPTAWEYKLGIRSAMEWILDQYRESTPSDPTIREKFNTYKFADYKATVIDLLQRVCSVSVGTVEIMKEMEKTET